MPPLELNSCGFMSCFHGELIPLCAQYLICFPRVLSRTFGVVVEEVPVLTLMPSAHALLLSQQEHVLVVLAGMNILGLGVVVDSNHH